MKEINTKLLQDITTSFSVISDELARYDVIKDYVRHLGHAYAFDAYGNLLVGNTENPKVVVAAHVDEVGVMVKRITQDGLLEIVTAGYIHPATLLNTFIDLKTKQGYVRGYVLSGKMFAGGLDGGLSISDLRIDIGVTSAESVSKLGIQVGTLGCYSKYYNETKDSIESTAIDNGVGIYVLLEVLKNNPEVLKDTLFLFHRGEENGSYGARSFSHTVKPKYAVVVDYMPSYIDSNRNGDIYPENGKGPSVVYMAQNYIFDQKIKDIAESVAQKSSISIQKCFMATKGDSEVEHFQINGCTGIHVCVPARGFHGCNYICNKKDILSTYTYLSYLLAALRKE